MNIVEYRVRKLMIKIVYQNKFSKKLVQKIRVKDGRKEKISFCIIDAQSIKNADYAEEKGYDAGNKVSGMKRHIAVDTNVLSHAIHVTTADITDREGALEALSAEQDNLFRHCLHSLKPTHPL